MREITLLLITILITSCAHDDDYKLVGTSKTDFCFSAEREDCMRAIDKKCKSNYIIKSEKNYEYYLESDRIVLEYKCK